MPERRGGAGSPGSPDVAAVRAEFRICRPGCGACCIAASISTPLPGMPRGKPAGVRCVHLLADYRCAIHGSPERPDCCERLRPAADICGDSRVDALRLIAALEHETGPAVAFQAG